MLLARSKWQRLGYRFVFDQYAGQAGHFELCDEFGDALAHISFRPHEQRLIINTRIRGAWDDEKSIDLADQKVTSGYLLFSKNDAILLLSGQVFYKFRGIGKIREKLTVFSDKLPWALLEEEVYVSKNGNLHVKFLGVSTILPALGDDENDIQELFALYYATCLDSLKKYIGTGVFSRSIEVHDYLEPFFFPGLILSKLWPHCYVTFHCRNQQHAHWVRAAIEENDITNATVQMATPQKSNASSPAKTEIVGERVIFGPSLVESGKAAGILSTDSVTHLFSIETKSSSLAIQGPESDKQPAGNVMVKLHDSQRWTANRFQYGDTVKRRLGVDVVVAMYNTKDYIEECVESLLCDGRNDVNIIVVDDGSTDGSPDVVRARFGSNPQVSVQTKANGGCASARNYGRLLSNSTHIAFVDADDFVDKGFFSSLLDLALHTGFEVVQGGFDFYDQSRSKPFYPSYEVDQFRHRDPVGFGADKLLELSFRDLVHGQPSIWRRVYRRDFLDAKNIYFPENVRAYDDYLFHLLTVHYGREVLMNPAINYHYRQHADQDIKKGDERHFYEIYMFRLLLKRSILEGWNSFEVFSQSLVNCIRWSLGILKDEMVGAFLKSGAELCATVQAVYGDQAMSEQLIKTVDHVDFLPAVRSAASKMKAYGTGYMWAFLDNGNEHPDVWRARRKNFS